LKFDSLVMGNDEREKFLLCLDSASRVPGVSLFSMSSGQEVESWAGQGITSENLLSNLIDLLQNRGISLQRIESIVISVGPGSFTGIRAGISIAKGIKFGCRGLKLLGASNLEALAMASSEVFTGKALCVIDAGRDRFFTQEFFLAGRYKIEELGKPGIQKFSAISQYGDGLVVSSGVDSVLGMQMTSPSLAKYLGIIALAGRASETIEPLYISSVVYRKSL
jgi:tRNA threonylcarbamoyl adenosine modification protein YeaZ